ncbi:DUF2069 domain-containing protein [Algicola sagamiensis]|uniref:DUF2069 domain-containing protein n=1 Tax=Algicola sagamiensis TaxID=163869 RepID=UPI00035E5898|nr:DUF2069 domain-containing protein [Algicola sagamiensis]
MNDIPMQPKTMLLRTVATIGYCGLLLFLPLWFIFISPSETVSLEFQLLVFWAPLLLPAKGLMQGKPYTFAWANFVVLIPILHGLTSLWVATDELGYVIIELVFASMMLFGGTYYARNRGQELGLKLRKLKQDLADEKKVFEENI